MAYSDYNANVYCNGERRRDREDIKLPNVAPVGGLYHGIIGNDDIIVCCYKQGLPKILEKCDSGWKEVEFRGERDYYDFAPFSFEYKGYQFFFQAGGYSDPYVAEMEEPNGDEWRCEYNYGYNLWI